MSKNRLESKHQVDIEFGDEVSKIMYDASAQTYQNRPGLINDINETFSGFRAINLSRLGNVEDLSIQMGFDGVGTKVEVSERLNDHSVIAHDLFAMVCDDAVARGGEPIAVGSIIDFRELKDTEDSIVAIKQLANGYIEAARKAGVIVVNGEVAELGDRVNGHGEFNYNWGAAALWVTHKSRVLDGQKLEPGQSLVGLPESGFRSNGLTDVRNVLEVEYGPNWHNTTVKELGKMTLGQLVQQPSRIYTRFITSMTGGFDINKSPTAIITGVAHITGGGIPSKLGRMLEPAGLGAEIDKPLDPPPVVTKVHELSGLADEDAFRKWNMGHAMIVATPDAHNILGQARIRDINAQLICTITESPGIRIKNNQADAQNSWIEF